MHKLIVMLGIVCLVSDADAYHLYPRESESREVKLLNGVWKFRVCPQEDQDVGFREKWFAHPLDQVSALWAAACRCIGRRVNQVEFCDFRVACMGSSIDVPVIWGVTKGFTFLFPTVRLHYFGLD